MSKENINKLLVEIQQSLTKIDSARVQVEKVTKNGSELAKATHLLAKDVKNIADVIKNETSSVITDFSVGFEEFENKIDESIHKSEKSITQEVVYFKDATQKLQSHTESAIAEIRSLSSGVIKKQEADIVKTMNTIVDDFTSKLVHFEDKAGVTIEKSENSFTEQLESFIKEVSALKTASNNAINETQLLSVETIKNQEAEMAKTMDTIVSDFTSKLDQFEERVGVTTEKSENSISEQLGKFSKSVAEITNTSNIIINEVTSLSIETLKKQSVEVSQIVEVISGYSTKIQTLADQLSTTSLSNELEEFNKAVAETHTDNLTIQKNIENLEKDIADRLSKSDQLHKVLFKKQRINSFITWSLILLSAGAIAVISNL